MDARHWKLLWITVFLFITGAIVAGELPKPADHFGFVPGADRKLFRYEDMLGYLEKLDAASDRMVMREVGRSPMGKPMVICFLSDPGNLARLDELKAINRKLALDADMDDATRARLMADGRVFVMATLSMHSTEVGPSQAFPLFAYTVASGEDEALNDWLKDVVLMVFPCHNPDGMDMVVDWYHKNLGTRYEGTTLPGVYHKYVGHDNNRDFVTLTQDDTRVIAKAYSTEWFPQVLVEKHQMGSTGPRYFVPEYHDPIAQNIDEGVWNWVKVFGANLSRDMTADGCLGVASHWTFDDYWPGSTETSLWKNVISLLTEAASCRVATPVYVEPNELSVRGKGLSEYKKGVNLPAPWPGGWWRLSDIVKYELSSTRSIIRTASAYKRDILAFRNDMCRKEVAKGRSGHPFAFLLPKDQRDPGELQDLVNLLQEHGVGVYELTDDVPVGNTTYLAGTVVVPLAQPYRAFIKEVMEAQRYPVRHYTPGGEVIRPYDIASWSLPLHRGLEFISIDAPMPALANALREVPTPFAIRTNHTIPDTAAGAVLSADWNDSYRIAFAALQAGVTVGRFAAPVPIGDATAPAGSFFLSFEGRHGDTARKLAADCKVTPIFPGTRPDRVEPVALPRIALVESWFHDMDAGWTRFIFDQYQIPYRVLRPGDFEKTDFSKLDVVVIPDESKDVLLHGSYKRGGDYYVPDMPEKYRKGMGDKGFQKLLTFVNDGGVVVCWRGSTALFMGPLKRKLSKEKTENFMLPIRDIGKSLQGKGLYAPGSLLRVQLKPGHPLTFGMGPECGVFSRGTPVFATSLPRLDTDRRVIGIYPEDGPILLSGYAEHEELLKNRTAAAWLKKGKGQIVMYAFNPQFRASTTGIYKLLFNALLLK